MTKKQWIRLCTFLLLTALMLGGLNWLLRDRETSLSSLYSEPRNSVDVFIVGSSHVNSGYIPAVLWQEYGISAHNVYSWSQPMWISYHYIREGLKTQSPKVVVLDLNGMLYGQSVEQPEETDRVNYANSFSIDPGINFWEMAQTVASCGIDLRDPIDFLPLIRYHSRWKHLDKNAFTYDPHRDPSPLKGYGFQIVQYPAVQPQVPATEERLEPYVATITYLDKIVALSEEKDFELVFVLAPFVYRGNEAAIFNWLEDYADAHGIPFWNYCTEDGVRIGLDWSTDFCDSSHVNYLGALKLTRDLGEHLSESMYPLRDADALPNAAELDRDAAQVYHVIELWECVQKKPDDFLRMVRESGGTLAVAAGGDASTVPAGVIRQLQQLGFEDISCVSTLGTSYAALFEEGRITEKSDPTGAHVECTGVSGELAISSQGAVTQGARVRFQQKEPELSTSLLLYYYDPILERPVYRIEIGADGNFVYHELVDHE